MRKKRVLSLMTAAVMAVPCVCIPSVSAIGSDSYYVGEEGDDYEEPVYYIPDFPQEILDEFGIDWTGLASNRFVEDFDMYMYGHHAKLEHDGGYAMYQHQSFVNTIGGVYYWHDCDSFRMSDTMDFSLPEYVDELDLKIELDTANCVLKEGELKTGVLLELNSGSDELFIVENYTSVTDFSDYEKIGSYTSDDKTYELYKAVSDEDAPGRYYAVNTAGTIKPVSQGYPENMTAYYSLAVHLSNLKELTGTENVLDKYGALAEGKGGSGQFFFTGNTASKYFMLPEEKLLYDENGEPAAYDIRLEKNLDGYRYSLQTADSGMPADELKDGRYQYTQNENNSFIIPKGNGTLHAEVSEGMRSGVSTGKEYDGNTPLIDKDYSIDYEYAITDDTNCISVSAWTLEPHVKISFAEDSQSEYLDPRGYLGTVELDDEIYELYNENTVSYDNEPCFVSAPDQYLFIHKNKSGAENDTDVKKGSFPISALVRSAEGLGIKSGNLCRISLNTDVFNKGYEFDVLKNEITEEEFTGTEKYNVRKYVDVVRKTDLTRGEKSFYTGRKGYMHVYDDGSFSAGVDEGATYFISEVDREYGNKCILDTDNSVIADYKLEDNLEGGHQIGYEFECAYNQSGYERYLYHIIEKSEDYACLWDIISSANGLMRSPSSSIEYVKTYTAGGHEYDLYVDENDNFGRWGNYTYRPFIIIRKDQDDSETLEGSIDLYEHISQIDEELLGKLDVRRVAFEVETSNAKGNVEVLKNDITFGGKRAVGDFNSDRRIDSLDVVEAKQMLLKHNADEAVPEYMDTNHSGSFEIADVLLLQSFVLGKVKTFVPAQNAE